MIAGIVVVICFFCSLPAYCKQDMLARAAAERASSQSAVPQVHQADTAPKKQADFEILRIEERLRRISADSAVREAFYREIDRLVARVRKNQSIPLVPAPEDPPDFSHVPTASSLAVLTSSQDLQSDQAKFDNLLSSLSPSEPQPIAPRFLSQRQRLDERESRAASSQLLSRLLYWARKNGCPPQLALATAWQESRMSLSPPDGSSGEIGMMQILPARAEAEGVDPRRLRNPDVDMWLGTRLLARYYREQGSISRAAMMYVAGPHVFEHRYPADVQAYIHEYSSSVEGYARYFAQYVSF
jgi:soluble lytic murein transglycosylase-like protein